MSSTQEVGEIFGQGAGPAHAMLRSPTVLIASVGLWGMNVLLFRVFGINYVKVLKYDLIRLDGEEDISKSGKSGSLDSQDDDDDDQEESPRESQITWLRLVVFSISLLALLHFTYYYWIEIRGGGSIGAVFAFYSAVAIMLMLPLPSTAWLRKATHITLSRTIELVYPRCHCLKSDPNGPRPIPFVDVFFADALCSLSKVFFDWGMLLHMASHYPEPVPPSAHNILIPSACAAIPYLIRARQCLIMYTVGRLKKDPKRYEHIANAIKYSTSIFPLVLSAYQKTIDRKTAESLEPLLIILLAINALYALWWDIVKDWGMMQSPIAATTMCVGGRNAKEHGKYFSCAQAFLRSHLRFGIAMSTLILVADSILRFSWLLRFYHKLFPSGDSFVLCSQFLEIFRRALWNLLRVEWENLKQSRALTPVDREDEEQVMLMGAPGHRKRLSA